MSGNSIAQWAEGKGYCKGGSKLDVFGSARIPEQNTVPCWTKAHMGLAAGPHDDVAIFTSAESVSLPSTAVSQNLHTKVALMVVWQSSSKRSERNTFQTVSQLKSYRWETSHLCVSPLWLPHVPRCLFISIRLCKWNWTITRMMVHLAWRCCQS